MMLTILLEGLLSKNITPILSVVGVLGAAYITGKFNNIKIASLQKKNTALTEKIEFLSNAVIIDFSIVMNIHSIVLDMFSKTKADRCLIFLGKNGKHDVKYATAILEFHQDKAGLTTITLSFGATKKFINYEVDERYRSYIYKAKNNEEGCHLSLANLDPTETLGLIYSNEKVNHSTMFYLRTKPMDDENNAIFYGSMATHHEEEFTQNEKYIHKIGFKQIKEQMLKI